MPTTPITQGNRLPDANFIRIGDEGPETISVRELTQNKKVIIFGVPGAFTPTCHSAHVPSFIRTREAFLARGIQDIICISVNDPFVLMAWSEITGAKAAGISMLSDADSSFTKAMGLEFTALPVGLINRSKRYALYCEDGVVQVLHQEESPGTCDITGGEALLLAI